MEALAFFAPGDWNPKAISVPVAQWIEPAFPKPTPYAQENCVKCPQSISSKGTEVYRCE
jgi:hypothetical protein